MIGKGWWSPQLCRGAASHQVLPIDVKSPKIDPAKGALLLDFRVNFGNTSDLIAIRAVGLWLVPK